MTHLDWADGGEGAIGGGGGDGNGSGGNGSRRCGSDAGSSLLRPPLKKDGSSGRHTPGGTLLGRMGSGLARSTTSGAEKLTSAIRRQMSRDRSGRYRAVGASEYWRKARRFKSQVVLVHRWWRDVNYCHKRMWLSFKGSHTLLAGVVFKGTLGFTRTQTVMVLLNSMALELVVLSMFYSEPSGDGSSPLVINPVKIVVSGTIAASVCIPAVLVIAWLFSPMTLVRVAQKLLRLLVCFPCTLGSLITCACRRRCCPTSGETRKYNRQLTFAGSAFCEASADPSATLGRRRHRGNSPGVAAKVSPQPCMSMAALAEAARLELAHGEDGGGEGAAGSSAPSAQLVASVVEQMINEEEEREDQERAAAISVSKRTPRAPNRARIAVAAASGMQLQGDRSAAASSSSAAPAAVPATAPADGICTEGSAGAEQVQEGADAAVVSHFQCPTSSGDRSKRRPPPVSLPGSGEGGAGGEAEAEVDVEEVVRVVRTERRFSYASLDEHMLTNSMRRSIRRKDWRRVASLGVGWLLNWLVFLGLLFTFSTYGCSFYSLYTTDAANNEQLLLSWLWSVGMRFLINEPFLICIGKGLPMIFASAFCANFCSETIVTCLGITVEGIATFIKSLKTG